MKWLWRRLPVLAALAALATAQTPDKRVILLLGPPGAGKTTQADRLKSQLKIPVVSMADLLRREGGGKSEINKALKEQIASGDFVSDEVANELIRKRITRKDASRGFILDGYPTTVGQAKYFDSTLEDLGLPKPIVIHLSVSDSVADARLNDRGRADDKPANIERRIVDYREHSAFVLNRYAGSVHSVDGGQSADAVAAAIRKVLGL